VSVSLPTTTLADGVRVHCVTRAEARVLDHHVRGYLEHGIDVADGDVVFDVGANIGLLGVRACLRHAGVRVYAFEPVPRIAEACRRNAAQHGGGRFKVLQMGLSDRPGEARFTWYPNAPALSTARPEDWEADPGAWKEAVRGQLKAMPPELWWARLVPSPMLGLVAWALRRGAEDVTAPLSTVSAVMDQEGVARVDLLKVDCEGFELDVLLGVEARHWPHIHKVVVEVNDRDGRADATEALLRAAGFDRVVREKEPAFQDLALINLYATRSPAAVGGDA